MSSEVSCFRHFLKAGCDLLFCSLDIPKCPLDGEEILRDQYFRDRCCEREVHNLQCFCRYRERGCDWKGELGYLKVRLQQSRWGKCFIQGHPTTFFCKIAGSEKQILLRILYYKGLLEAYLIKFPTIF